MMSSTRRRWLNLFLLRESPVGERAEHAGLHVDVAAEDQVVEDGHPAEQGDVLEGAGDAELGDRGSAPARSRPALEDVMRPRIGMVEAADHVEHRRLAGAVGPDDREDLALLGLERDTRDRLHAAERLDASRISRSALTRATAFVVGSA